MFRATEKLKFLFNNQAKKITAGVILFFAFLAQSDFNVWFLKMPDFDQLTVSEGKIRINRDLTRLGEIFTLVINNQKIPFNCGITGGGGRDCVLIEKIPDYQGKIGKVWWYRSKNVGWLGGDGIRFYQLEVNGKLVISYQKQIESYLSMKSGYLYPNIVLLIISIIMFFLMQFANDPITPKRNKK